MDAPVTRPFVPSWRDPRWPFAALLTLYCVLGVVWFGFNRTPGQMAFIMLSGCALDVVLTRLAQRVWVFPLSAWITCASLAILMNYSKHSVILFLPVLLAIGSKHVFTFRGKHVFNPSMFGVSASLLVGGELITAAPAYQWAGASVTVTFFLITAALLLFVFRIRRAWLIGSFLVFYAMNTGIRAFVMRHHLPPEMLFIGTMTTPPFYLFTLYMITDPATSPAKPSQQVLVAFLIAAIDLVLHLKESVYTFFYAALIVGAAKLALLHGMRLVRRAGFGGVAARDGARAGFDAGAAGDGARAGSDASASAAVPGSPAASSWWSPQLATWLRGVGGVAAVTAIYGGVAYLAAPHLERPAGFAMERVDVDKAGIGSVMDPSILEAVDPRLQHISKWLLSVGDAVATGDVDGDGRIDLFFSNPLKRADDRAALYVNRTEPNGALRFERVPLPALDARVRDPKKYGLPSGGTFADWDGDGDLDLAVPFGFGKMRLLKNMFAETGKLEFVDVTEESGIDEHTISLAVTFFDYDNDGDLDMLLLNATSPVLRDYDPPRPLNIFDLPQPEYDGDRRMFHFMHNGWHDADNGGGQILFDNDGAGHFTKNKGANVGLTGTRWSLAVATADFNHDGFTDLYVANDFGPDELLLNTTVAGSSRRTFTSVHGPMFNDVGNDTYKGMNASLADFDGNGFLDVTVSNVHHELQAEGSMMWMVSLDDHAKLQDGVRVPTFSDEATQRGALNEHRFGWGAAAGDLDNDGWPDLVQANGMVDDRLDLPEFKIPDGQRKDYWYVNHKLMQSGPDIHTYADMWGDLRGRTIYPDEKRRAYLNLGASAPGYFVDVADQLGVADPDDSRGVALVDLDNDGDLDLVIANQHGPASLYQSRLRDAHAGTSHYVDVELRGARQNTRGVGALVTVTPVEGAHDARGAQVQEVHLLGGLSGQDNPRLHFGLGAYAGDVDVEVRWPGGVKTKARAHADAVTKIEAPCDTDEAAGATPP